MEVLVWPRSAIRTDTVNATLQRLCLSNAAWVVRPRSGRFALHGRHELPHLRLVADKDAGGNPEDFLALITGAG